jgi:hypothetical protein
MTGNLSPSRLKILVKKEVMTQKTPIKTKKNLNLIKAALMKLSPTCLPNTG